MDKTPQTEAKGAQPGRDGDTKSKPEPQEDAPIIIDLASI